MVLRFAHDPNESIDDAQAMKVDPDKLADFYQTLRDDLRELAQAGRLPPEIQNFEHLAGALRVAANAGEEEHAALMHPDLSVGGQDFDGWIHERVKAGDRGALLGMAEMFRALSADKEELGIAHGDLQHRNLKIHGPEDDLALGLMDFDSFYTSRLASKGHNPLENGHENFQHPAYHRPDSKARPYDRYMDRFSEQVIYLTLLPTAHHPDLWTKYYDHDHLLLFSAADFDDPDHSELFHDLMQESSDPVVRRLALQLASSAKADPLGLTPLEHAVAVAHGEHHKVRESIEQMRQKLTDLMHERDGLLAGLPTEEKPTERFEARLSELRGAVATAEQNVAALNALRAQALVSWGEQLRVSEQQRDAILSEPGPQGLPGAVRSAGVSAQCADRSGATTDRHLATRRVRESTGCPSKSSLQPASPAPDYRPQWQQQVAQLQTQKQSIVPRVPAYDLRVVQLTQEIGNVRARLTLEERQPGTEAHLAQLARHQSMVALRNAIEARGPDHFEAAFEQRLWLALEAWGQAKARVEHASPEVPLEAVRIALAESEQLLSQFERLGAEGYRRERASSDFHARLAAGADGEKRPSAEDLRLIHILVELPKLQRQLDQLERDAPVAAAHQSRPRTTTANKGLLSPGGGRWTGQSRNGRAQDSQQQVHTRC